MISVAQYSLTIFMSNNNSRTIFNLYPMVELNRREQRKRRANDFAPIPKGTQDSARYG
jgi:hypothetical protein